MARLDPPMHIVFNRNYTFSPEQSHFYKSFSRDFYLMHFGENIFIWGRLNNINTRSASCSMMMSDQSSSVNDVAMRRCSKCRNHGVLVQLKGHKPFCRFRNCSCMACCRLEEKKVATRIRKKQLATAIVQTGPVQVDPVPEPPQQRPCSVRYHPYTHRIAESQADKPPETGPVQVDPVPEPPQQGPCSVRYHPYTHRIAESQADKPPESLKETKVPPGLTPNHKPASYYINNLQTKTLWEKTCDGSKMMQYTNITKTIIPKGPNPTTGASVAKARKMEPQPPTYCMPGPNPATGPSVTKARKMEPQPPTHCMPGPNPATGPSVTKARKMEPQPPTQCMPGPNPATRPSVAKARKMEPQPPTQCMPGPNPATGVNVAKTRKMEPQPPTYCMPGLNLTTGANVGKARNLEPLLPTHCMPAPLSSSNLTTQPSTTHQAGWTGTKTSEIYQTTVNPHLPTYALLTPVSHVGLMFSSENTFWARQDQDMLVFNQQWNVQHTNF